MITCQYCNQNIDELTPGKKANHVRWCLLNPKRKEYLEALSQRSKNRKGIPASESRKEKIKQAHKNGKYDHIEYSKWWIGKTHSDETKEKIRKKALESSHRRLKKSTVEYKGVLLDSSWELALAKRLDDLNIKWIRPDPIKWKDDQGKTHNYFPDFYLPDYDLFLDPKNPYAKISQKKKLSILTTQIKNLKIISSLDECTSFNI